MKKQQRRVFLKVIAAGPLVGCLGSDPSGPSGFGGAPGAAGTSPVGTAGTPSASGTGNTVGGGGSSSISGAPGVAGSPVGSAGSPASGGSGTSGVAGASSAGTAGTVFDPNDPASPVGNVSQYPLGSFSIAGSIYFIGHDAGGLFAMSMQCTHKFCAVEMQGNDLYCPCHFSKFDHAGNVLVGPATTPLPHFKLTVDGAGNITVDRFTVVSQSARTKV